MTDRHKELREYIASLTQNYLSITQLEEIESIVMRNAWRDIEIAPHNNDLLLLSGKVQYVGFYADKYTIESGSDDDDFEYNENDDTFYCTEGWYENQNNWGDYRAIAAIDYPPTKWMPIPKPKVRSDV